MGQADMMRPVAQRALLVYACGVCAHRVDATAHGGHMLADGPVQAFDKGRGDVPTTGGSARLDRLERPAHDAVAPADQAATAIRLDHLRIEAPRSWPPARLGRWTSRLAAFGLHPVALVRPPRG